MRTLYMTIILVVIFLSGCNTPQKETNNSNKTRHEKWVEDIVYFEDEFLNNSQTYSNDSIASCKLLLTNLKDRIDTLSDSQIILELSRADAMANNGHTTIHLNWMSKIPLRFHWFADGLYVIKTDAASSKYLGSKILGINSIELDKLQKRMNPYLSGIGSFKKYIAVNYFSSPEILHGIRIGKRDSLTLTLLKDSDTLTASFGVKEMKDNRYEYDNWANLYPDTENSSWRHVIEKNDNLPLYLKHMKEGVFYEFIDSKKMAYFSINALWYKSSDFKGKINEFLDALKTRTDYDVTIDLRYYTGGNFMLPTKLATKPPNIIDEDKKIYLITSNMTFSAGLITAARVKHFAKDKIVVVGEKVGDNLKFRAEAVYYKLPNSGVEIQDSKYEHDWKNDTFIPLKTFWVNAFYGVAAKDLEVDQEIQLSFEDYMQDKDPILDWILNEKKQFSHLVFKMDTRSKELISYATN